LQAAGPWGKWRRVEYDLVALLHLLDTALGLRGELYQLNNMLHRDCHYAFIVCLDKVTVVSRQAQRKIGKDVAVADFDVVTIRITNECLAQRIARIAAF
jgi:hypothetical protein